MSDELVFYSNPMSRARVTRWMLEELGQPYRTELLEYGTSMKSPEYLAINPMGKVPAIRHRGVTVTEGAAICVYLADAFPEAGLAPAPTDPLRGTYYRWIFFASGPVEQVVLGKSLGLLAPEDKRGQAGYGTYEDTLNALETAFGAGPFILGERFSAADVYVGATLGWGMGFKLIEPRPAFTEYWERLRDRPAAKRAAALDDEARQAMQRV